MKFKRQSKIIELISNNVIETQEELACMLREAGFLVTQATISRDIRELKLCKIVNPDGRQKYALSGTTSLFNERAKRIFKDSVVSVINAQNIIVIKTISGMAMGIAACIDSMNIEILGSIAGDDTIICVAQSEEISASIIVKLREMMNNA